MPSQMTMTRATSQPSIDCGPMSADMSSGMVMNGPAPIMFVMLSAVAGSRPKWRVSWELAGAVMARQYYAMTNGVVSEQLYAGFWIRTVASIIDCILLLAIILPIELAVYGREYLDSTKLIYGPVDFLVSWVFPV